MKSNIPKPKSDSFSFKEEFSNNSKKTQDGSLTKTLTQGSMFKFEPSKMFQRKPSFKMYQRKQKKVNQADVKICFISPQKSDIFKKHPSYRAEGSDYNSSVFTINSRQGSCIQQNKNPNKSNQFFSDLSENRSMFIQLDNQNTQVGFRTPKIQRPDMKCAVTNSRKLSTGNFKFEQFQGKQDQKNNFDKDFDSLMHINGSFAPLTSKQVDNDFQSQKVGFRPGYKKEKENIKTNLFEQNRSLKFHSEQLQYEVDKLKRKCERLDSQKVQIQQSSKLFLQQIKGLQTQILQSKKQNQNHTKQIARLNQQLAKKNSIVAILQIQLKHHRSSTQILQDKMKQSQSNENYKLLYFNLNQQFKYLVVEKDILKKMLDQKKDQHHHTQKLQFLNKKLTAKNKYLIKQVQMLEKGSPSPKGRNEKFALKDNKLNPSCQRKQVSSVDTFRLRQNHSKSVILGNGVQNQDYNYYKNQTLQSVSNASSLEFSLELSPNKNSNKQVNRFSFFTNHKNSNVSDNFSRFRTAT